MFDDYISNAVLTLVSALLVLAYFYVQHLYSYWQRRGVPFLKPSFPCGNFGRNFTHKLSISARLDEIYYSTSEPFIGVYAFFRPTLVARDPEFIRNIFIKDFQHFMDRGVYVDEENDPISAHLFSLEGSKWQNLRAKLTPTFTSGKMKQICATLLESQGPLVKHMEKVSNTNETVEVRELTACYTTNAIASVAFGIDIDCLADPETPFRKYGRQVFEISLKNAFRAVTFNLAPKILKWSGVHFVDREVEDFVFGMVNETLSLREKQNIVRKDFFQMLVQLRNTGSIKLDDEWQTEIASGKTLTMEELAAQAYVFYTAGFETTSSAMSFCLFEIARNAEIQERVHTEIDEVLAKYDGQLTYDAINELKYLDACLDGMLVRHNIQFSILRKTILLQLEIF